MWLVKATAPKCGWVYSAAYFPRKVKYKSEAQELVNRALELGRLALQ